MTRTELQELSKLRLNEAQLLLAVGSPSGAYYLAGYAVECALKACIAKSTLQFEFPDKQRALDAYTHNLSDLVRAARLRQDLDRAVKDDQELETDWEMVKAWSESSRYTLWTDTEAAALIQAAQGVLQWVQPHW